jgi:nicotinamidase/pyrazinamidase
MIFWDVDTQVDFMEPGGKLYFEGAEEAAPALAQLVEAGRAAGIVHVASADDHELVDPEISEEPDWRNTYPPHCLRGTRGAERIAETKQHDPLPLSLVPFPPEVVGEMIQGRREIVVLKKSVNVFTNPNVDPLLDALDPDEIVVFGVATDICDDIAIRGFLQRGRRVRFVEDAARGLDSDRIATCTTFWREHGVEFTTTQELLRSLG